MNKMVKFLYLGNAIGSKDLFEILSETAEVKGCYVPSMSQAFFRLETHEKIDTIVIADDFIQFNFEHPVNSLEDLVKAKNQLDAFIEQKGCTKKKICFFIDIEYYVETKNCNEEKFKEFCKENGIELFDITITKNEERLIEFISR